MTSSSAVSSDLSQNLCFAYRSSISIHRLNLFNGRGMGIAIYSFHQGPEWFTKAIRIFDLPSFSSNKKFGSFVPINSKLILSPKNFKSSWTFKQWDGSYTPLPWFWSFPIEKFCVIAGAQYNFWTFVFILRNKNFVSILKDWSSDFKSSFWRHNSLA